VALFFQRERLFWRRTMRPLIVTFVAGLIVAALSVGKASAADPPVVVAAPAATAPIVTAPTATVPITTAPTATAPSSDSWRYKFYNGYWWYWTPDNRWLCYMNGQWIIPGTPAQTGVIAYPYQVVPQPYYYPYPYGYGYPYPYFGGGIYVGGGFGGYWHGGYGGYGGHHR
jgi:hypothetical protein